MQGLRLGPHALQLDLLAVIDETDQAAPALETLQSVAILKDRLRVTHNTTGEDRPQAVEMLELGEIQAGALSGLRADFRCKLFAFLQLLCPRQEFEQDGDFTYELSLDPPLPLSATFCSVELPISTVGRSKILAWTSCKTPRSLPSSRSGARILER